MLAMSAEINHSMTHSTVPWWLQLKSNKTENIESIMFPSLLFRDKKSEKIRLAQQFRVMCSRGIFDNSQSHSIERFFLFHCWIASCTLSCIDCTQTSAHENCGIEPVDSVEKWKTCIMQKAKGEVYWIGSGHVFEGWNREMRQERKI